MKPLVSVIIPLYNKAPYLRRALESIASQTFADFEAIVVDDGSTDGSERIAAEFADPRFRVLRQPNRGPGSARNLGIAEARGELLAFLDADDEWLPDFLETTTSLLEKYGPNTASVSTCWVEVPGLRGIEELWQRRKIPEGVTRLNEGTPALLLIHLLA